MPQLSEFFELQAQVSAKADAVQALEKSAAELRSDQEASEAAESTSKQQAEQAEAHFEQVQAERKAAEEQAFNFAERVTEVTTKALEIQQSVNRLL